jgi:hypothetical protein
MAHRVNAMVNRMQHAAPHASFDRPNGDAELAQLVPGHHPVLPIGELADERIHRRADLRLRPASTVSWTVDAGLAIAFHASTLQDRVARVTRRMCRTQHATSQRPARARAIGPAELVAQQAR